MTGGVECFETGVAEYFVDDVAECFVGTLGCSFFLSPS